MPRVMISLTSFDRRITRHEDILEKMQRKRYQLLLMPTDRFYIPRLNPKAAVGVSI